MFRNSMKRSFVATSTTFLVMLLSPFFLGFTGGVGCEPKDIIGQYSAKGATLPETSTWKNYRCNQNKLEQDINGGDHAIAFFVHTANRGDSFKPYQLSKEFNSVKKDKLKDYNRLVVIVKNNGDNCGKVISWYKNIRNAPKQCPQDWRGSTPKEVQESEINRDNNDITVKSVMAHIDIANERLHVVIDIGSVDIGVVKDQIHNRALSKHDKEGDKPDELISELSNDKRLTDLFKYLLKNPSKKSTTSNKHTDAGVASIIKNFDINTHADIKKALDEASKSTKAKWILLMMDNDNKNCVEVMKWYRDESTEDSIHRECPKSWVGKAVTKVDDVDIKKVAVGDDYKFQLKDVHVLIKEDILFVIATTDKMTKESYRLFVGKRTLHHKKKSNQPNELINELKNKASDSNKLVNAIKEKIITKSSEQSYYKTMAEHSVGLFSNLPNNHLNTALSELRNKKGAKDNEQWIVLMINESSTNCNTVQSWYTTKTVSTGCPPEWKPPNSPHAVLQNDIKKMVPNVEDHDDNYHYYLKVWAHIDNKILYIVVHIAEMDLNQVVQRIKEITTENFFKHHIATSQPNAQQKSNNRIQAFPDFDHPNTVINIGSPTKIGDARKVLAIFDKQRLSSQMNTNQRYSSGVKVVVHSFKKREKSGDTTLKEATNFSGQFKFYFKINEDKKINHLENDCSVQRKTHDYCEDIYRKKKNHCYGNKDGSGSCGVV